MTNNESAIFWGLYGMLAYWIGYLVCYLTKVKK
jgi:hypothetical protein